jgi:two-component system response regulator (stage 0 sporulation protein F)
MATILLVDDDDPLRTVLRINLTKWGHRVVEARNGKLALALVQQEVPDMVVTDLVMPEMEGLEFIRELRRTRPEVKIIAMSGGGRLSATGYLKMAKAMGARQVLAKPFAIEELKLGIESMLQPRPAAGGTPDSNPPV